MDNWALSTYCFVSLAMFAYIIFFIVIMIGGMFDLAYLFKSLKAENADPTDDGRAKQSAKADNDE